MKKFIAPIVLFFLTLAVVVYLLMDSVGTKSSFDASAYLQARSRIDSLEVVLWESAANPDAQLAIRGELETAWADLNEMRSAPPENPPQGSFGLSGDTTLWIAGGVAVIILCIVLLVALSRRKKALTQQMEAVKHEQRFREPKNGFEDEPTVAPRKPRQKRSIIDDVSEYAEAQKHEETAPQSEMKVAFEDENGVPENKILSESMDGKPTLRPTAKERITSAMQSLSDVLRAPRGLSRDRTMKLRAQSHNVTGDPSLQGSHPLETSRFDRELTEKSKILQMSRRGFPASAIASQLKIPQDQVEAVVKEALNAGN